MKKTQKRTLRRRKPTMGAVVGIRAAAIFLGVSAPTVERRLAEGRLGSDAKGGLALVRAATETASVYAAWTWDAAALDRWAARWLRSGP